MARCYILASMSNVLQHQHEHMATAYDMMMNLKKMFGDQNRAGRQVAMKALLNTKMAEGTSVQEHVPKMIAHLNEYEILGAEIDGETVGSGATEKVCGLERTRVGCNHGSF